MHRTDLTLSFSGASCLQIHSSISSMSQAVKITVLIDILLPRKFHWLECRRLSDRSFGGYHWSWSYILLHSLCKYLLWRYIVTITEMYIWDVLIFFLYIYFWCFHSFQHIGDRHVSFSVHFFPSGAGYQCKAIFSLLNSPVCILKYIASGSKLIVGFESSQVKDLFIQCWRF